MAYSHGFQSVVSDSVSGQPDTVKASTTQSRHLFGIHDSCDTYLYSSVQVLKGYVTRNLSTLCTYQIVC